MKRKVLLGSLAALVVIGGYTAYLGVTVGRDLLAARDQLSRPAGDLDVGDITEARGRLQSALDRLGSVPANVVSLIPVLGQNLGAVEATAEAGVPLLEAALALDAALGDIEERGLIRDGAIQLEAIEALNEPLVAQRDALANLEGVVADRRNGWLAPPLWDALDGLVERAGSLHESASGATELLEVLPGMLGTEGARTYLAVLVNNAELRGAGGIPSGVGTIAFRNGRLDLGPFVYYGSLSEDDSQRVKAPPDFKRRYGAFKADTTVWVNTTLSPDVPEVAIVAARLYRRTTSQRVDGVMFIDPRGLSALLPPDEQLAVPGSDRTISASELPTYVYSTAYQDFEGAVPERREALLGLGTAAFERIVTGGLGGRAILDSAGDAVSGGHIRFVPFDRAERAVFERLGVTGALPAPEPDALMVVVQNFGGDKLDHWVDRTVKHSCRIDVGRADCEVAVTLANTVPDGLTDYVAKPDYGVPRPYGLLKSFLEIYIPQHGELTSVTRDDDETEVVVDHENGLESLGVYVEVEPHTQTRVAVTYTLALDGTYGLTVTPQPLTHDAELEVELVVPNGWTVVGGPGEFVEGVWRYQGPLHAFRDVQAAPSARTGLPALWERLARFWREPVF